LKRSATSFGPEGGQAVILLVAAMGIFMFGALGLAVDGGQIYAQYQMAQAAADAAAEAGILSIEKGTNATSTYTFGTGATPIASYVCTTTDGRTPCVYARDNGFGATASDTVTLSYPATISGVTLSSVAVPAFSVTVKRILNNGMIRFVGGPAHTTISAKATAGITGAASTYCIYALNSSASGSFSATDGAAVDASGCGIAVNSSDSSALTVTGSTVTASVIDVVGKTDISNGGSASPDPVTGAGAVADPFASLPVPPLGNCTAHPTTTNPATNAVLTPGTYCGGIYVGNGATNVTFSPGIYIIDGGGVSLNGSGSTVLGSGVMFYLTGTNSTYDSVAIQNGVSVIFSAPASGTYQGVLFFQDRSITSTEGNGAAVTGGASMAITGTFYFPTTNITFSNGTSSASYIAIIAQQVWFTSGAKLRNDPTGTYTGLSSKSVVLAQ
jgi:Flp pilus assembly protein TadG